MKYAVGTMWYLTNPETKVRFAGEVLDLDDNRIKKIKCQEDVCLWFEEIQWGTTYDAEFLDEHATAIAEDDLVLDSRGNIQPRCGIAEIRKDVLKRLSNKGVEA